MNVLVVADKNYLKYSIVLMQSIICNHPNDKICLYVATSYHKSVEYHMLENFMLNNNCEIHLCQVNETEFSDLPTSFIFTKECYYILNVCKYLPDDLERILYLDSDIIVHKNISEMYNMDLRNAPVAVCAHRPNFTVPKEFDENRLKQGRYFNSGVILFNLKCLRERFFDIDFSCFNFFEFSFDQGVLNYLYAKDAIYIETMIYNYRFSIRIEHYDEAAYYINNNLMKIYHYTNAGVSYKPWDLYFDDNVPIPSVKTKYTRELGFYMSPELNDHYGIWWYYAKKTPIWEQLYYEMNIKREYICKYNLIERWNDLINR